MEAAAIVMRRPHALGLETLPLLPLGPADVLVEIAASGISTGTERLLWTGRMPDFPGMGYPLVPGYEAVGRVAARGPDVDLPLGASVFVPGARCFGEVRGLFGAAAERLVVPAARALPIGDQLGESGVLLALAATALHAIRAGGAPDLIIGHGVLGRLAARLTLALGHAAPDVWEVNPLRARGAEGYRVLTPDEDPRRDRRVILDVSGDASLLDALIQRLAPGGEIVLAGFYAEALHFAFPPAFMSEARLRVAAQWAEADLVAARDLALSGQLALADLITHRAPSSAAEAAYRTAFEDAECLKMIIDWRGCA